MVNPPWFFANHTSNSRLLGDTCIETFVMPVKPAQASRLGQGVRKSHHETWGQQRATMPGNVALPDARA